MAQQAVAEEWLPPGWTVEIRVRKNGKRDWYYFDPSKEYKFRSKPEVSRYLKSIEKISKPDGKRKSSRNRPPIELEKTRNKIIQIGDKKKSEKSDKKSDLPRRASKRLAGIEAGPIPDLFLNNKTRRISAKTSLDKTNATLIKNNKINFPIEGSMPKNHNLEKETSTKNSDDVALQDLWNDPCIEFAIKTLTGQLPLEEGLAKNKAPNEVPEPSRASHFGDFWADPCIDFAIKTLTGDIPIDGRNLSNFFRKTSDGSDLCRGSGAVTNMDGGVRQHCENRERNKERERPTISM